MWGICRANAVFFFLVAINFVNISLNNAQTNCIAPRPRKTGGYLSCGKTFSDTTKYQERVFVAECGTNTGRGGAMWYYFKAGTNQQVRISTCNDNTAFDTKLGVFTCDGDCIGGNDDSEEICTENNSLSTISFTAEATVIYNILIHGYRNETGVYELSVDCEDLPEDATTSEPTGAQAPANASVEASVEDGEVVNTTSKMDEYVLLNSETQEDSSISPKLKPYPSSHARKESKISFLSIVSIPLIFFFV